MKVVYFPQSFTRICIFSMIFKYFPQSFDKICIFYMIFWQNSNNFPFLIKIAFFFHNSLTKMVSFLWSFTNIEFFYVIFWQKCLCHDPLTEIAFFIPDLFMEITFFSPLILWWKFHLFSRSFDKYHIFWQFFNENHSFSAILWRNLLKFGTACTHVFIVFHPLLLLDPWALIKKVFKF